MKVLVIPEDQELDRYIVKPIVEALLEDLSLTARVDVLPEPRLRGAGDALDPTLVAQVVADNPMTDLFVLIVDRDCNRQGHDEKAAARAAEHPEKLVACVAVQEVEVWLLALYPEKVSAGFREIRAHCDPKEEWAEPLLRELGSGGPGAGRKRAMRALAGRWRSLRDRCTELRELQQTISTWNEKRRERS